MAMPFTVDAKTLTSVMLFLVSKVIFRCRVVVVAKLRNCPHKNKPSPYFLFCFFTNGRGGQLRMTIPRLIFIVEHNFLGEFFH